MFNKVKACIPLHWKDLNPSTVAKWLHKVKDIMHMENFTVDMINITTLGFVGWNDILVSDLLYYIDSSTV